MNKYRVLKAFEDHAEGDVVELEASEAKGMVLGGLVEEVADAADIDEMVECIKSQIAAAAKDAATEAAKEVFKGVKGGLASGIVVGEPELLNDPKCGYKHVGEFCKDVHAACTPGGSMSESLKAIAGGSTISGPDGGYLIPDEFSTDLQSNMISNVDVLGKASFFDVGGNSLQIPELDDYDKSDDAQRHGGVRQYWTAEGGAITTSNPDLGNVQLKLKKSAVLVPMTDELLEDSAFPAGQLVTTLGGAALADAVDDAAINGDGVGRPEGVRNAACFHEVAKESGQTADTIVAENVLKMWAAMPDVCKSTAEWLINPEGLAQLGSLTIGDQPVFMSSGITGTPNGTLMGRPIVGTDLCQALGDSGDIILADWKRYVGIQKAGGVQAATSIHLYFDTAQTAFRLIQRVDGRSWNTAKITPKYANAGFRMSPFVGLAARA